MNFRILNMFFHYSHILYYFAYQSIFILTIRICPYHFKCHLLMLLVTLSISKSSLVYSFLTLTALVTPFMFLKYFISTVCILLPCLWFALQFSLPNVNVVYWYLFVAYYYFIYAVKTSVYRFYPVFCFSVHVFLVIYNCTEVFVI